MNGLDVSLARPARPAQAMRMLITGLACAGLAAACGDDGGASPDARADAPDASIADAAVDAGFCANGLLFTGEYVDWDSTPAMFQGIFEAQLVERGNPDNAASTAPNGRGTLCLPAAGAIVDITQPDYVPAIFTVDPDSAAAGAFAAKGLTPMRLGQVAPDNAGKALALIEVRRFSDGAAVPGASVELGAGSQLQEPFDGYLLVTNIDPSTAMVALTFTAPDGVTCDGPTQLAVAVDTLSLATFACQ